MPSVVYPLVTLLAPMGSPNLMVTQVDLVKLNGPQSKTKCRDSGEDTGQEEGV